MSVESICDKVLAKSWKARDSRPRTLTEGIYVIGEKKTAKSRPIYLYAGRSEDVKRRLDEHLVGTEQKIDRHIQALLRNKKRYKLCVKWVSEEDQEHLEEDYIECLRARLGPKHLRYNIIRGASR